MSRRDDWHILESWDAFTGGDLRRAVHAAGHDFALGVGVRYTGDLADFGDPGCVYRVRAWFGEELLFDSGESETPYAGIAIREGEWGSWQDWTPAVA